MTETMPVALTVDGLVTGYGTQEVLKQVNIEMRRGEVVAIIGHNGAGKSTLLKAIFGLLPVWSGEVAFPDIGSGMTSRALLRHGVAYAPQGNRVFHRLTVLENLKLSAVALDRSQRRRGVERALEMFPALRAKEHQQAGTLSGGEKQTLALACVMSLDPHVLLLDEPSLGLSPSLVKDAMSRISRIARDNKVGCLVVEQKVRQVLRIADRVYALRRGSVAFAGTADELEQGERLREVYL